MDTCTVSGGAMHLRKGALHKGFSAHACLSPTDYALLDGDPQLEGCCGICATEILPDFSRLVYPAFCSVRVTSMILIGEMEVKTWPSSSIHKFALRKLRLSLR